MQRLGSSSCHQYRIQTVLAGNRSLLVIDNGICERLHLGNECAGVAVPHYLVGYAVYSAVCGGQNSGVRGVVLVLGTAFGAEFLNALVVTVNCIYLGNFAACEEAGHIEVVDHHIVEDTAGNLNIGYRGRLRIAGGNLDDVDLADLAVTNHVVNCAVVVVEAAAETDLQLNAGFLGCVDGSVNLLQIIIDRLLAEDVLACVSSLDDVLGMGVGRGANQNCIDLGIVQNVVCVLGGVRNAAGLGKSLGLLIHKRVSDGLDLHLRYEHGNILRMYLTDTTRTDNTYFHGCSSLNEHLE